jgi:hypothetical protein
MSDELECMCLECGISLYLPRELIILEQYGDVVSDMVREPFCVECGGRLKVVGRPGEEPFYRVRMGKLSDES